MDQFAVSRSIWQGKWAPATDFFIPQSLVSGIPWPRKGQGASISRQLIIWARTQGVRRQCGQCGAHSLGSKGCFTPSGPKNSTFASAMCSCTPVVLRKCLLQANRHMNGPVCCFQVHLTGQMSPCNRFFHLTISGLRDSVAAGGTRSQHQPAVDHLS